MKKKLATKAVTLATTGVVTATSIVNPAMVVVAETAVEGTDDSVEAQAKVKNEVTEEQENTEVTGTTEENNTDSQSNEGTQNSNPEENQGTEVTPEEPYKPVEIGEMGVTGKVTGKFINIDGVYYSEGMKLSLGVACMREGVTVSSVEICGGSEDNVLMTVEGGTVDCDLPDFEGGLLFRYVLSDGVSVIVQNASDVITELKDVINYHTDATAPVETGMDCDCEIAEVDGNVFYTTDGTVSIKWEDVGSGINEYSVLVEGLNKKDYTISSKGISFKTDNLKEGLNSIKISVSDKIGNKLDIEKTFDMYRNTPIVTVGSVSGDFIVENNNTYIGKKCKIDVQLKGYEDKNIKKIELLNGTDVVEEIKEGNFSISDSGTYSIKVIDKTGEESVMPITDLTSELEGSVIKDEVSPKYSMAFDVASEDVDGIGKVYTEDGNIILSFKDEIIDKETFSFNVPEYVEYNVNKEKEGILEFIIDSSKLVDGNNSISYRVQDKLGNIVEDSIDVFMLRGIPSLSGKSYSRDSVFIGENFTYVKDKIDFTLSDINTDVVKTVELIRDGSVIDVIEGKEFSVSENGDYAIRVTDILDNSKDIKLNELFTDFNSSIITVDKELPVLSQYADFTGESVVVDDVLYYTTDGTIQLKLEDGKSGIKDSSVVVKNKDGENINCTVENGVVNIDSKLFEDGSVVFVVSAMDNVGNVLENAEIKINLLREFPNIVGKSHSRVYSNENTSYFNTDTLEISLNGYDNYKISKIELLKEDSVVKEVVDGEISIPNESGVYSIKVTDILGNIKEYTLEELFSDGSLHSNIVYDNEGTVLESREFTGEHLVVDNKSYYTTNGDIILSFKDVGSGIDKDTYRISGVNFNVSEDGNSIVIDTEGLSEGETFLSVKVKDNLGNETIESFKVFMHRDFPEVVGSTHGGMYTKDEKSYMSGETKFSLKGFDSYKVKSVELIKDGEIYSEIENGEFTIAETGTYKVRVTDIVNKHKDYTLEELYGDCYSNVVLDENSPEFSSKFFDGKKVTIDGIEYYTENGNVVIEYKDSLSGIDRASWKVEGISRDYYTISEDGNSMVISTEKLKEGNTEFTVSVSDMLGQKSTKDFSIFMHREFPVISGVSHTDVYLNDGVSYTDKDIEFKLSGYNSYKIKNIALYKDNEKVEDIKDGRFALSKTGNYTIRVTDIVNTVKEYKLEDLFNEITSNIVFDMESPEFVDRLFTGEEVIVDGVSYYTTDGDIKVSFSDKLSGIDKSSWSVSGVAQECCRVSEDGLSVVINTENVEEGNSDISVAVEDMLGNREEISFSIYMHRYAPEITGKSHSDAVIRDGIAYSNKTLTVELGGTEQEKIRRIELLKDNVVVNEIENGNFSVSENGEYVVRVVDLVNNAQVYRLEDLFSDLDSNIVVDTVNPVAKTIINGEEINTDKWVVDEGNLSVVLTDDVGLSESVVSVNGKDFRNTYDLSKEEVVNINLLSDVPRAENGKYSVEVKVKDISGNTVVVDTKTISADFDKPTFSNLDASGNYVEDGDKVYFKGDIVVSGDTADIGSGIEKVELLKDGKVISKGIPVTLDESGSYIIRVTDNAGLYTEIALNTILGTTSNDLIADNEAPAIKRISGFSPDLSDGGKDWFKKAPTLEYFIKDENIKNISIKVNGDEKVGSISENGIYSINTEDYEGRVEVSVEAIDKIGNTSMDTFVYYADFTAPTDVKAVIDKESKHKSGKIFFKEIPTVSVYATDNGVGLSEYKLSGSKNESNSNGTFKLGTGTFNVEILDKLGNTTGVLPINTLLGLEANDFVVDDELPEISLERPESPYKDWYNSDINGKVTLRDNIGIDSAKVVINGVTVDNYSTDKTDVKEVMLSADTSKVNVSSNGMYEIKVYTVDNAGNEQSYSDVVYIDRDAPVVNKFVFNGDGYMEGVESNGSNRYGFFFNGSASCDIYVSDGTVSSGIKDLKVKLESVDGSVREETLKVNQGIARVVIPNNFKGFVSAYAVDNVNNTGDVNKPDGVVTEDSNWHMNSVEMNLTLPDTEYTDISGNPLYNKDVVADAEIGCSMSGLRTIKWGIDGNTLGTLNISEDGIISGDTGVIKSKDKNLVLSLGKSLAMQGNANGMKLWVSAVDRVGHTSEVSKVYSIDKDSPEISVSYDKNEEDTYYNTNRVATIIVRERNFDPSKFRVEGESGSLGSWSNNGDIWTNTISCTEDRDYNFKLSCVDRAGNASNVYESGKFTVDKTAPVMSVSWNVDKPSNGNYYNQRRTATVTVIERNFDSKLFTLEGSGSLSGWSSSGDRHIATVNFDGDGEFEFALSGQDLAGNTCEKYSSGKFNIDATMPVLEISGIENSVSYKEDVGFTVKMSDENIDVSNSSVTLTGRKQGNIRVNGIINEKSGEFQFMDIPREEVYDDVYTLSAKVTDKAGNVVNKDIKFSVNRFGSKYKFLDASILGTYLKEAKDIVITENNVDKLDTESARVSVIKDGVELPIDEKYITIEESGGDTDKYNYTYTISKEAFKEDGKYLVQIYSHAIEGTDYSSVSQEYAFVLDTTKPEILISGVEDGKRYKDYSRKVSIDVRDKTGVKDILVTLNGKKVPLSKNNGIYSFEVKESKELQNISVEVTDMAGNRSTKSVEDFLISSDAILFLVNQNWFKWGIGALIAFLGAIIALITKSRIDRKREEKKVAKEYAKVYNTTTGGSSSSSDEEVSEDSETEIMENEDTDLK